jgi:uncharacterized protein involved in exopolysaccharide biosynthesis
MVEVGSGTIENPLKPDKYSRSQSIEFEDRLRTFVENSLRWEIMEQVVDEVGAETIIENRDVYNFRKLKRRLSLPQTGEFTPEEERARERARKEGVVRLLQSSIHFTERMPKFLVIKYRGIHSDVNAKILNTLVMELINEKNQSEASEAERNYEFIEREMELCNLNLEKAEACLKEFKEEEVSGYSGPMEASISELAKKKADLANCELELRELDARLHYLNTELETQDKFVVSRVTRDTHPAPITLDERIVDLEIELARLTKNYTELHPKVIELRAQIMDLKNRRKEFQETTMDSETTSLSPIYEQLENEKQIVLGRMEALKNRTSNLKDRIRENEEKLQELPDREIKFLALQRDYDAAANVHNMLSQKLEEARLQGKLAAEEKDKENFRVLEFARASLLAVGPRRSRINAVILFVGLMTSVGIMALLSFLDDSLKSVDEAKEFLNKPFLGFIPSLNDSCEQEQISTYRRILRAINKL